MPIQAINTQRLYQQAADQISHMIRSGEYKAGGRLPAERDLARQLGVSRPTVREALIALEIAGFVEVRTGSGAYIKPRALGASAPAPAPDTGPSAFELIAARRVIEPAVAALAAQTITAGELSGVHQAIALGERRRNGTHWEKLEADQLFHTRVAEASHNTILSGIVVDLWKGMFGPIFAVLSERTQLTHQQTMTLDDHRTIAGCLERRDGAGAAAAMLLHLVHVEEKLGAIEEAGFRRG
jgi:DNA-binding FadR family transcriptional regulator